MTHLPRNSGVCLLIALITAISIYILAVPQPNKSTARDLIVQWEDSNNRCRGGFGNDPATYEACDIRSGLFEKLNALGFCHGEGAEYGYQTRWAVCESEFKKT